MTQGAGDKLPRPSGIPHGVVDHRGVAAALPSGADGQPSGSRSIARLLSSRWLRTRWERRDDFREAFLGLVAVASPVRRVGVLSATLGERLPGMVVESVAVELYGLRLSQFTAARDAGLAKPGKVWG